MTKSGLPGVLHIPYMLQTLACYVGILITYHVLGIVIEHPSPRTSRAVALSHQTIVRQVHSSINSWIGTRYSALALATYGQSNTHKSKKLSRPRPKRGGERRKSTPRI